MNDRQKEFFEKLRELLDKYNASIVTRSDFDCQFYCDIDVRFYNGYLADVISIEEGLNSVSNTDNKRVRE